MCSTPFGVKDRNSLLSILPMPSKTVLNAFRRQRSEQNSRTSLEKGNILCSTPFGVKDRNSSTALWFKKEVTSAQRLSASKIGTDQLPDAGKTIGQGAQRLSASKIGTGAAYWIGSAADTMCSTPFGVKDRNRMMAKPPRSNERRCSTPFGVKDRNSSLCLGLNPPKIMCSTPFGVKDRNSRWRASLC